MRLHDRLDAARQTVDHLTHDTLPFDKLSFDKLPLDQLRSMPDHLRSVPDHLRSVPDHLRSMPEQLAGHLPDELPRSLRRRLPRRTSRRLTRGMRAALPRRRRMTTGRWVFVLSVVLAVAVFMTLRRLAERVDGALTDRAERAPDSGPAPAGRVPFTAATTAATPSETTPDESAHEAPLLDA